MRIPSPIPKVKENDVGFSSQFCLEARLVLQSWNSALSVSALHDAYAKLVSENAALKDAAAKRARSTVDLVPKTPRERTISFEEYVVKEDYDALKSDFEVNEAANKTLKAQVKKLQSQLAAFRESANSFLVVDNELVQKHEMYTSKTVERLEKTLSESLDEKVALVVKFDESRAEVERLSRASTVEQARRR